MFIIFTAKVENTGNILSANKSTVAAVLIAENLDPRYRTQYLQVPQMLQRKPLIANKGMALLHTQYRKPATSLNSGKRFPTSIGKFQDKIGNRKRNRCCPKHILKEKLAARRRQQLKLHVCAASSHSSGCVDLSDTESVKSAIQEPTKKSSVDLLKSKVTSRLTPYSKPNVHVATSASGTNNSMNNNTNTGNVRSTKQESTKKSSVDVRKSKVSARHTPYPKLNVPVAASASATTSNLNANANTGNMRRAVQAPTKKALVDVLKSKVTARHTPYPKPKVSVAASASATTSHLNPKANTGNVRSAIQAPTKKASVDVLKSKCTAHDTPYSKPNVQVATSTLATTRSLNPNVTGGKRGGKRVMQYSSAHVLQTKITARRKPFVKPDVVLLPTTNSSSPSTNTNQSQGCTSSKRATHDEGPNTQATVSKDLTSNNNEPVLAASNLPAVFITSNVNVNSNVEHNAPQYNLSMQNIQTQISQAKNHDLKTVTSSRHMQYTKPQIAAASALSSMKVKNLTDVETETQYRLIAREQQFLNKETSQTISSMLTPDTFDSDLSTCSLDTVSTAGLKIIQHDTQSEGDSLSAALTSDSIDPVLTACNLPAVLITTGDDNLPNIQYTEFGTSQHNRNIHLHPKVSQNVTHDLRSDGTTAPTRVSLKPNDDVDVTHTLSSSLGLPASTAHSTPQYKRGMAHQQTQISHGVIHNKKLKTSFSHEKYHKSDINVTLNTDNLKHSTKTQRSMFQYNHDMSCLQAKYSKGVTHDLKPEMSLHHAQYFKPDIGITHVSTTDNFSRTTNTECSTYTHSNRDMPSLDVEFSQNVSADLNPIETTEELSLNPNVDVAHTLTNTECGTLQYNRDMPTLDTEFTQNETHDLKSVEILDGTTLEPGINNIHNINAKCATVEYNYDIPNLQAEVPQDIAHDLTDTDMSLGEADYIKPDTNCPLNASSLKVSINDECATPEYSGDIPCLEVQFSKDITHDLESKISSDYAEYFKPDINFAHTSTTGTLNVTADTECSSPQYNRDMPCLGDQFSLDVSQDLKTEISLHQPQYTNITDAPVTDSLRRPIDTASFSPNYNQELTSLVAQFSQDVTRDLKPIISLQPSDNFKPDVSFPSTSTTKSEILTIDTDCVKSRLGHNTPSQQIAQNATHDLKSDISLHDLQYFKPDGNTSQALNTENLALFTNIDCSTSQHELKEEMPPHQTRYFESHTSVASTSATGSLSSPTDNDCSSPHYNADQSLPQSTQKVTHNMNTEITSQHQSDYIKPDVIAYTSTSVTSKPTADNECSSPQFNSNIVSLEIEVPQGETHDLKSEITSHQEQYLKLDVSVDQMSNSTDFNKPTDTESSKPQSDHDILCLQTQDSQTITYDLNSEMSLHQTEYQKSDPTLSQPSDNITDECDNLHYNRDMTTSLAQFGHDVTQKLKDIQAEYSKPDSIGHTLSTGSLNLYTDADFSTPQCKSNIPTPQERISQDITDELKPEISLYDMKDLKSNVKVDSTVNTIITNSTTNINLELTNESDGSVIISNRKILSVDASESKDEKPAVINTATPCDMQYSKFPVTPVIPSASQDLTDADMSASSENIKQGEDNSVPASSNNDFDALLNDCNISVDTSTENLIPDAGRSDSFCPQGKIIENEKQLTKEHVSVPSVLALNTLDNSLHNIADNEANIDQEVARCPDVVDCTGVTNDVVETIITIHNSPVDLNASNMNHDINTEDTDRIEGNTSQCMETISQETSQCMEVSSPQISLCVEKPSPEIEHCISSLEKPQCIEIRSSEISLCIEKPLLKIQQCTETPSLAISLCVEKPLPEIQQCMEISSQEISQCIEKASPKMQQCIPSQDKSQMIEIISPAISLCIEKPSPVTQQCIEILSPEKTRCVQISSPKIPQGVKILSPEKPQCTEIPSPAIPRCIEIPSSEIPQCLEIPSPEVPQCVEIPSLEIPQCVEIPSPEVQLCVEIPSPKIPQCVEIPSPAKPPCVEIPSPEIPQCIEIPSPKNPQCIEIPSPEIPQCVEIPSLVISQCIEVSSQDITAQCMEPPTPQNEIEIHEKEDEPIEEVIISIEPPHDDTKNLEVINFVEPTSYIVESDSHKSVIICPPKSPQAGPSRAIAIDHLITTCELTLSSSPLLDKKKSKRVKSAARTKDREISMSAEAINELECHFSRSGRGRRLLAVDGIKYRVNNVNQGKVRWRCSTHERFGCKAKIHTIDNSIVYFVNEHITSSPHENLDDIEPIGIIEDED